VRVIGARGEGVPILVFETLEGFSVFVKDLSLVSTDVADPSVDFQTELAGCGRGSHPGSFLFNSNSIKIGQY
jgi:hypothetical protein